MIQGGRVENDVEIWGRAFLCALSSPQLLSPAFYLYPSPGDGICFMLYAINLFYCWPAREAACVCVLRHRNLSGDLDLLISRGY